MARSRTCSEFNSMLGSQLIRRAQADAVSTLSARLVISAYRAEDPREVN